MIDAIKDLKDAKINNSDKKAEIHTYMDAIKFLHDLKLNYMRHYEFYFSNNITIE